MNVPSPIELPTLIDIETLAGHLGVTIRHVRRLVAERRVPYVKVGALIRFDPADIAAWLQANHRTLVPHDPTG
jgi:excisionase family DNA binding protein